MKLIKLLSLACMCMFSTTILAQKLTIDKVYKTYLRNSGAIVENGVVKGYYVFMITDKIDRRTNEYTVQIVDQNLSLVRDIKFQDSKEVVMLEASYNGDALAFLFYNEDERTTELKIYGLDGKLRSSYLKQLDKKTQRLWQSLIAAGATKGEDSEGGNVYLFDVANAGFTTVLPFRDGSQKTYQVDFYNSKTKGQWSFTPTDEEKWAVPSYLGSTDSLLVLEVMKKKSQLSTKIVSTVVALNFHTKKQQYELTNEKEEFSMVPMNLIKLHNSSNILLMGSFFDKDDNIATEFSKGVAMYEIESNGKIVNKKYNNWNGDMSKYLPLDEKGRLGKIGFLYTHNIIQTPDGKFFAISEGYKKNINAAGVALTVLMAASGRVQTGGMTKMMVTDIVVMEFDKNYKITNAKVYDKQDNSVVFGEMSDFSSQHALAIYIKNTGGFDYQFTTGDADHETFSFCYFDYAKTKDSKGQTFNSVTYNGEKFTTDQIKLNSKATFMRVFPAKPGFVTILEYFKKERRVDARLEKLN